MEQWPSLCLILYFDILSIHFCGSAHSQTSILWEKSDQAQGLKDFTNLVLKGGLWWKEGDGKWRQIKFTGATPSKAPQYRLRTLKGDPKDLPSAVATGGLARESYSNVFGYQYGYQYGV